MTPPYVQCIVVNETFAEFREDMNPPTLANLLYSCTCDPQLEYHILSALSKTLVTVA